VSRSTSTTLRMTMTTSTSRTLKKSADDAERI